ncbi:MAG: queuosine precursor transporter [Burkholderiaceae bacterium]
MSDSPATQPPARAAPRYYDFILAAFVCVLLCANFIGAAKQATLTLPLVGAVTFGAGVLFFPISYLFSDILTEVYGYGRDRRAVWAGFAALVFASVMAAVVVGLPAASSDFMRTYQGQLEGVFGNAWRIALASMLAFWCGSFANSYVMAKMKVWTAGRWLWSRTIGSTVVGELIDSGLFYFVAFYGIWETRDIIAVTLAQYLLKTLWEVVATPLTYAVVGYLKRAEGLDHYDRRTNFNPFRLRD